MPTVTPGSVIHCQSSISVVSQNRPDRPGNPVGNYVHDNKVVLGAPTSGDSSDKTMIAFDEDWASGMYSASPPNHGALNAFWSATPEPQWARFGAWAGTSLQTLAALNATPAGGASTYLTTAQRDAALSAAGIPLTP